MRTIVLETKGLEVAAILIVQDGTIIKEAKLKGGYMYASEVKEEILPLTEKGTDETDEDFLFSVLHYY